MPATNFYAYVHARPDTVDASGIFYVGKGHGNRAKEFYGRNFYHSNVIAKHGTENILIGRLECSTEEFAFMLEKGLIKTLRRMGVTLTNMTDGGEGVSGYTHTEEERARMIERYTGRKASEETKEKMRLAHSGVNNPFYGRKHSEESKAKVSQTKKGCVGPWAGKTRSEETKKKISVALTGKPGVPHTEEAKIKISAAQKGRKYPDRKYSDETRRKLSEAVKLSWERRKQLKQEN